MPSALAADLSVWPSAIRYTTRRSASVSGLKVERTLLVHFVRRAPACRLVKPIQPQLTFAGAQQHQAIVFGARCPYPQARAVPQNLDRFGNHREVVAEQSTQVY